jgi:hypothetical protein
MALTPIKIIGSKYVENALTLQYTSAATTTITAAVLTNESAVNVTVSVYLVESGDTAGGDNEFIASKVIPPGRSYFCPELIGQTLSRSDFISTIADVASSVNIRISGTQFS